MGEIASRVVVSLCTAKLHVSFDPEAIFDPSTLEHTGRWEFLIMNVKFNNIFVSKFLEM